MSVRFASIAVDSVSMETAEAETSTVSVVLPTGSVTFKSEELPTTTSLWADLTALNPVFSTLIS